MGKGKKTRKSAFGWLLCATFVLGGFNGTALSVHAENRDLTIAGVEQDSSKDCSGTGWSYTASTHTLTLNGISFDYTGEDEGRPYAAILYTGAETLNIDIKGKNNISGYKVGMESEGALVFKGEGSLNVNTEDFAINSYQNGIVIESGDISFTALYDGINTNNITIKGGNVKAIGTRCNGMQVVGENAFVKINGGNVIAEGQSGGSGDMSSGIYCLDYVNGVKGDVIISEEATLVARAGTNVADQSEYVAIYGKVKNEIAGKGWADYTGTGAATDIAVNTTGEELTFKRVQFPTVIDSTVHVTGVTLNKTSLNLTAGGSETLTAAVAPADATNKTVTWSSNNTSVANVNGGKITAVSAGKATITATADGKSATCEVTVTAAQAEQSGTTPSGGNNGTATTGNTDTPSPTTTKAPAAKGDTVTDTSTNDNYIVNSESASEPTVEYKETGNTSSTSVKIPDTVTVDGIIYKVTAVADKAFSGNKKIKTVTIGKNVTKIGTKAFANCTALTKLTIPANVTNIGTQAFTGNKKLKIITIKSTKLTSKSISKNAFKGVGNKVTIKVPKSKKKAYTTLFRKKGLSKKVKIK